MRTWALALVAALAAPAGAAEVPPIGIIDLTGQPARAHAEARALAALGAGSPPAGVPAAVWARWADLEVDVLLGGDVEPKGRLRVESSEPDTVILLDGRELGPAPVEVDVTGGLHTVV